MATYRAEQGVKSMSNLREPGVQLTSESHSGPGMERERVVGS